jgi:SAM-dependent methyltransferase
VFLVFEAKSSARRRADGSAIHFNEIAEEYGEQFSPHMWNHLLDRKMSLLAAALPGPGGGGIGLDLGCGLGQQCVALGERGYRVVGVEAAEELVRRARKAGVTALAGNGLALPFRDGSFEFVYAVGVLHHLPGADAQAVVCREVARVLKPGGLFIVHETNPRNLLFRFYMGYIFPILKSIDEGTEWWIGPRELTATEAMKVLDVRYFTFIPDFVPRWLMQPLLAVQRRLEESRLRAYSVHYMAVLRRDAV